MTVLLILALDLWALSFAARVEWKAWRGKRGPLPARPARRRPWCDTSQVKQGLPEGQSMSNTCQVIPGRAWPCRVLHPKG